MKVAKIKGIVISLHISTLLIIGLVGFYAADEYATLAPGSSIIQLIIVGLINGIIILFSILIHELTHSLIAQRYGLKVSEIELYLFGGVSKIEQEPTTPKSELIISFFGPISSLVLGGIFLGTLFLTTSLLSLTLPLIVSVTLLYSGITNVGLGIFNLLPAYPMDGGRVLRAILWKSRHDILSATKTAARVGTYLAYSLMGIGFLLMLMINFFSGLWLIIIASFLNNQSRHAYLQTFNEIALSKLSARELVTISEIAVPFNTILSEVISNYFMMYKKTYFPVIQGGEVVGIIHIEDVKRVPLNQRHEIIAGYVMKRINYFPIISSSANGKEAITQLIKMKNRPHLVAVKDETTNQVIGFIGEEDIVSSLQFIKNQMEVSRGY
ncbi:MAG: site-2 protease family protein [Promethearchaeota archaeon]